MPYYASEDRTRDSFRRRGKRAKRLNGDNNAHDEEDDERGDPEAHEPLLGPSVEELENQPVFQLIHKIRSEIVRLVDAPISWDQLHSPAMEFSIVRPLLQQFARGKHPALIYALLVNRTQFLREAETELAFQNINQTRATLSELLAVKILPLFAERGPMELVQVLTATFNPFGGAKVDMFEFGRSFGGGGGGGDARVGSGEGRGRDDGEEGEDDWGEDDVDERGVEDLKDWGRREGGNALEVAIFSGAKKFIRTPLCQRVINDIYTGRVIYQPVSLHNILSDNYKKRPVQAYDIRNRPFLDHYRLRIPRVRAWLEFMTFFALVILFLIFESNRNVEKVTTWEAIFIIWSFGLALDEFSSTQQHGYVVYLSSLWNFFDLSWLAVFFVYLGMRIYGLVNHNPSVSETAFDVLALGACILFPRLTGALISENVVILGLRAMVVEFSAFIVLAVVAASGFLFSFYILAEGSWSLSRISWLLLKIWFGNSFAGFDTAASFHPIFGPFLMTLFAAFSNTLLLTILISLLSNTFANIQANATEEFLFQKAIKTIEGVSSDALSEYAVPLNLIGLAVMLPASWILTPRWFHKLNVFMIRTLNFPILFTLGVFERLQLPRIARRKFVHTATKLRSSVPHNLTRMAWEGSGESLSRVFQRKVSVKACRVPRIDYDLDEDSTGELQESPISQYPDTPPAKSIPAGSNKPSQSVLSKLFGRSLDVAVPISQAEAGRRGFQPPSNEAEPAKDAQGRGIETRLAALEEAQGRIEHLLHVLVSEITKAGVERQDTTGSASGV